MQETQLHIAQNLYAKEQKQKECGGIKVVQCKSKREECEYVAFYIANKVQSGDRYKQFDLVVPSVDEYAKIIQCELAKYEIPCYVDSPKSIAMHPLSRLVDSLFAAISLQNNIRTLIELYKNILLNDNEDIFVYENFCAKYGIEYDDFGKDLSVGVSDDCFEVANQMHNRMRATINKFPKSGARVLDVTNSVRQFLNDNMVAEKLVAYKDSLSSEEDKKITERILDEALTILSDMDLALGDKNIEYSELYEVWQSGVEASRLKLVPPELDAVKITDISTSKHSENDNIILVGAIEEKLPTLISDNGVLTDNEIALLEKDYRLKVRPTVKHVNDVEKSKIVELFTLFKRELLITYPSKVGGEKAQESSCVTSLRNICLKNSKPLMIEYAFPKDNLQVNLFLKQKAKTKFYHEY